MFDRKYLLLKTVKTVIKNIKNSLKCNLKGKISAVIKKQ